MIAHVGIQVSDIERSKKFYAQALKPTGYQILREYGVSPDRPAASAGFGEAPHADLWIYEDTPAAARERAHRLSRPEARAG
jgi:catechol 2,3-dioxygenase-like lactoylglutathione lyase family enzyme